VAGGVRLAEAAQATILMGATWNKAVVHSEQGGLSPTRRQANTTRRLEGRGAGIADRADRKGEGEARS